LPYPICNFSTFHLNFAQWNFPFIPSTLIYP
jgi:hypothetical protein